MAHFFHIKPQLNVHLENVGLSMTVCICCLDQNVPFVKLAACGHCSFFEDMLKYKVRYREAVVCYQCHSFLKKIELFKHRAEESLRNLNNCAKIMKTPSNLNLSYSVPEITVIPNDVLSNRKSPTGSTAMLFKNEIEVPLTTNQLTEFSTTTENSSHNQNKHANINKTPSNVDLGHSAPEIPIIPNDTSNYNNLITEVTIKNEIEVSTDQLSDLSTSIDVKIEDEPPINTSNENNFSLMSWLAHHQPADYPQVNESNSKPPNVHLKKLLSTSLPPRFPMASGTEEQTTWKGGPYSAKFEGKIISVTLTKEQLQEERQKNAQKESYLRQLFKCESCIVGFEYEVKYKDHMEKRHTMSDDWFQCTICKSVLKTEKLLIQHEKKHYIRFECGVCGHRNTNFNLLLRHYNKQHEVIEPTTYRCWKCDIVFETYGKYSYHKIKEHSGKHKCDICDKICLTKSDLQVHISTKHDKVTTFPCKVCNKIYYQRRNLLAHMKVAHSEGGAKEAYCETCNQYFCTKYQLNHHLKYNSKHRSSDLDLICDFCGAKFSSKRDIEDHIAWKHMNIFYYKCERCSKPYRNKQSLRKHIKYVHENVKDPKNKVCDICGHAFSTKAMLQSHINTHTGERPFKCTQCADTFGHRSALYTHNKLKHKKGKLKKPNKNQ